MNASTAAVSAPVTGLRMVRKEHGTYVVGAPRDGSPTTAWGTEASGECIAYAHQLVADGRWVVRNRVTGRWVGPSDGYATRDEAEQQLADMCEVTL